MLKNTNPAQAESPFRIAISNSEIANYQTSSSCPGFEPEIKILSQIRRVEEPETINGRTQTPTTLIFIRYLTLLVLLLSAVGAGAQSGVTLIWDAVTNSSIAGYRVYQGNQSRSYSTIVDVGNGYQTSITNLVVGSTNYFAVTAYDANGLESEYSTEVEYVVGQRPPPETLVFAANSGTISGPFISTNDTISQPTQTTVADGGRADYSFTISHAGPYLVFCFVNAPDDGANSLFINIDAEPTDPMMIWDIPLTTGFQTRTASWRGEGGGQKIFYLQPGTHHLIIRGREANVQLSSVTVSPAFPTLQLTILPGNLVFLNGTAQIGQTYEVQATGDLKTWIVLQTITPDNTGTFALVDPNAGSFSSRMYRLRGVGP